MLFFQPNLNLPKVLIKRKQSMKMISYWKGIDGQPDPLEIYEDKEGLVFIIGTL